MGNADWTKMAIEQYKMIIGILFLGKKMRMANGYVILIEQKCLSILLCFIF